MRNDAYICIFLYQFEVENDIKYLLPRFFLKKKTPTKTFTIKIEVIDIAYRLFHMRFFIWDIYYFTSKFV